MAITTIPWPVHRVIRQEDWQPPAGTRVISADDHLMEPEHLWEERLPAPYRERAPRYWRDGSGYHLVLEGEPFDVPGISGELAEGRPGFWDQELRLKDMDAEGIDASFVFHGRTMGLIRMPDKDLLYHCFDVYNDWLAEWQAAGRGRLYGIAILPTFLRPDATADYIQKLKHLGFKAMELPSEPRDVYYNSTRMDPFWQAIEEGGIPVSFHVGAHLIFRGPGALGANLTRNLQPYRPLWALLAFSGVLERHPELKVIFTEGGASWAASAIYDADKIYREYETELRPKLGELPSYYWRRQCYATFMDDPAAIREIDHIGVDNVMWSVDYPHPESVLGEGRQLVRSFFEQLGEEKAAKIVGGNAARVWGIQGSEKR